MKQVSVGADGAVWDVNDDNLIYHSENDIYRFNGSSWTQMEAELKVLCAMKNGNLWGVTSDGRIFRRAG